MKKEQIQRNKQQYLQTPVSSYKETILIEKISHIILNSHDIFLNTKKCGVSNLVAGKIAVLF